MFVAAFLLFLLCQSSAEPDKVVYRCNSNDARNTTMTFNPASDGVSGRYTAELCTSKNPRVNSWTIDLSYYENTSHCGPSERPRRPDHQHSTNTLEINDPTNCTHVCYAMNFDLIFTTCYEIKSTFKVGKSNGPPFDTYHNITNKLTFEQISHNKAHVSIFNHDNEVTLYWFLGIPPTDFKVKICPVENNTPCIYTDVSHNCSVQQPNEVHCALSPPHGNYHALLRHEASWTAGVFNNLTFVTANFKHSLPAQPTAPPAPRSARVWWACGGALLGAGALLAAALLRRASSLRAYHKHVLDSWRRSRTATASGAMEPRGRAVLLLYAREGEPAARAVAALRDLVQRATGGQVYDIFSPEVTALSAPAPASWLRGVLQRDDVRVLLLQSPATAALYQAQLCERDAGLRLAQPLLGRRAAYRAPQFGDTLLQLALRLLAETPHAHHAYHKYYLATYSELQTEILPQVVPYRRYVLPDAAAALLRDLAPPPPPGAPAPPAPAPPPALQAYADAARAMLSHARDNPDYLMDELIIM